MRTRVKTSVFQDGNEQVGKLEATLTIKPEKLKELKEKAQKHFDEDPRKSEVYFRETQPRLFGLIKGQSYDNNLRAVYGCRDNGVDLHTTQGWLSSSIKNKVLSLEAEGREDFVNDFYKLLVQSA